MNRRAIIREINKELRRAHRDALLDLLSEVRQDNEAAMIRAAMVPAGFVQTFAKPEGGWVEIVRGPGGHITIHGGPITVEGAR